MHENCCFSFIRAVESSWVRYFILDIFGCCSGMLCRFCFKHQVLNALKYSDIIAT